MRKTEAQRLYDKLGTVAKVAEHFGWKSPQTAYVYLRKRGVIFRKRGGMYGRTHADRALAHANRCEMGDKAVRARTVRRLWCVLNRHDQFNNKLKCVFTEEADKYCPFCTRGIIGDEGDIRSHM